jgi:Na+-transporting methylmalonyl-CoA/oxaloacetate decarboxylase gamma subunit
MIEWALALQIFFYGIGGVFVSLAVLMITIMLLGSLFKPSMEEKEGNRKN